MIFLKTSERTPAGRANRPTHWADQRSHTERLPLATVKGKESEHGRKRNQTAEGQPAEETAVRGNPLYSAERKVKFKMGRIMRQEMNTKAAKKQ